MTMQTSRVSVIDPIEPAIGKVKDILFSPFDLGKWFVIGFCAWLANLGQGGGLNFNFPFDKYQHHENLPARIHDFVMNNLALVITIGSVLLVVGIIIAIVLLWLSSRGKFMFLHCVAQNKAEVKNPWHSCRPQGNSLFLFRLVVGIASLFCLIFCVAAVAAVVVAMRMYGMKMIVLVPLLIFVILFFILLIIVFSIVFKFTVDFVAPVMYLNRCTCLEGWRQFLQILSHNKGRFVLYILFQIVITMAVSVIVLAGVCLTCCCACCLMAIPYIGTVLLLPILVFQRAYSLIYLSQFGSQFDVFVPVANIIDTAV
jgi:hypothetical protein